MGVMERVYCASIFTLAVVVMYMCVRCGFGSSVNRFFQKQKQFLSRETRQGKTKGKVQDKVLQGGPIDAHRMYVILFLSSNFVRCCVPHLAEMQYFYELDHSMRRCLRTFAYSENFYHDPSIQSSRMHGHTANMIHFPFWDDSEKGSYICIFPADFF